MMSYPAQPYPVTLRSATQLELVLAYLLIMSFLGSIVIISAFADYLPPLQLILNLVIP